MKKTQIKSKATLFLFRLDDGVKFNIKFLKLTFLRAGALDVACKTEESHILKC